jgi:hypothetical protein
VVSLKGIFALMGVLLLSDWRTPCVGYGVHVHVGVAGWLAGWLASASAQRAQQLLPATPAGFLP